jgi:hypothetical protein
VDLERLDEVRGALVARREGDPAPAVRVGLVAFASSRSSRALSVSTSFFVATPMDSICFTTF